MNVGVRWTIGDVSDRGFEELRLSIHGAFNLFGDDAAYAVCVNTIAASAARARVGPLPVDVAWLDIARDRLPAFIADRLAANMSEGTGWKFAPLRLFEDRHELSLDNDCILWSMPEAIAAWLARPADEGACCFAADVRPAFGQFDSLAPSDRPLNSGIRGLPPRYDFAAALRSTLAEKERVNGRITLSSELDEQGWQATALWRAGPVHVVETDQVAICSPFWPHARSLGRHGAHFVGSNARHIAWDYYDRPADNWMAEHWREVRDELYERTRTPGG